jgi:hypothetical protein
MKSIYERLEEKVLPLVEDWKADLTEHDRQTIENFPGTPFLHFTGKTGTYLVLLLPEERYPKKGELIPYLFGRADREYLLKEVAIVVEAMRRTNRQLLIIYCDGKDLLLKITQKDAEGIVSIYTEAIQEKWKRWEEWDENRGDKGLYHMGPPAMGDQKAEKKEGINIKISHSENSIRDEVKDVITDTLIRAKIGDVLKAAVWDSPIEDEIREISANLADKIFGILHISPEDQDKPYKKGE